MALYLEEEEVARLEAEAAANERRRREIAQRQTLERAGQALTPFRRLLGQRARPTLAPQRSLLADVFARARAEAETEPLPVDLRRPGPERPFRPLEGLRRAAERIGGGFREAGEEIGGRLRHAAETVFTPRGERLTTASTALPLRYLEGLRAEIEAEQREPVINPATGFPMGVRGPAQTPLEALRRGTMFAGEGFFSSALPRLGVDVSGLPTPARIAAEEATTPANLVAPFAGGAIGAALRGTRVLRPLAPLVEPLAVRGGTAGQLAAEMAVGMAARGASETVQQALPAETPAPVRTLATLGAGLAAGGLAGATAQDVFRPSLAGLTEEVPEQAVRQGAEVPPAGAAGPAAGQSARPRAQVRLSEDKTTARVFVGNWAFPSLDLGHHAPATARRIARLYNQGKIDEALELAGMRPPVPAPPSAEPALPEQQVRPPEAPAAAAEAAEAPPPGQPRRRARATTPPPAEAGQPPVPQAGESLAEANKRLAEFLVDQLRRRETGEIAEQIRRGRAQQFARAAAALTEGQKKGLHGAALARYVFKRASGSLTRMEDLGIQPEYWDAWADEVARRWRAREIEPGTYFSTINALNDLKAAQHLPQPKQIKLISALLGDELTDLLVAGAATMTPRATAEQRQAIESLAERLLRETETLLATGQPYARAQRAYNSLQNTLKKWDSLSQAQAELRRTQALTQLNILDREEIARVRKLMGTPETPGTLQLRAERAEARAAARLNKAITGIYEARDITELAGPVRQAEKLLSELKPNELPPEGMRQALTSAIDRAAAAGDERIQAVAQRALDRLDRLERTRTDVGAARAEVAQARAEAEAAFRGQREGARGAEMADVRDYRSRIAGLLRDFRNARRAGDTAIADRIETQLRQLLDDALTAGDDRIRNAGIRGQIAMERLIPTPEALRLKAQGLLGTGPFRDISDDTRRQLLEMADIWMEQVRVLSDGLDSELGGVYQTARSVLTGELPDSYLTTLMTQRGLLTTAAEMTGLDPQMARKFADALVEYELALRYGKNIPERAREIIRLTKRTTGELDTDFWDTLIARGKNTAFGLADIGVFGVNMLRLLHQGNIPLLLGFANKALALLQLPHFQAAYVDATLNKRMWYALHGLRYGRQPSALAPEAGTILSYIPGIGRWLDRPLIAWSNLLARVQYDMILNWGREITFEGNLALLKLTGQDITDPRVIATAADNANTLASFAQTALRAGRAKAERTLLISPAMTRSQASIILQASKLIRPGATRAERLIAATTIASTALATLFVGKWLNDQIGTEEFEFDPSKPGFGAIRLANGTVINVFPQMSLVRAIARSIRELTESDFDEAAKAWGNFFLGRTTAPVEIAAGFLGTGYEPGRGFVYGDLTTDIPDRVLNALPMPPAVQALVQEQADLDQLAFEFAGVSSYPESAFAVMDRKARETYGVPYEELNQAQKERVRNDPEVQQALAAEKPRTDVSRALTERERVLAEFRERGTVNGEVFDPSLPTTQAQDNQLLQSGQIDAATWRERYQKRQANYYALSQAFLAGAGVSIEEKERTNPVDAAIDRYYSVRPDQFADATGEIRWDRYFAARDAAYQEAVSLGGEDVAAYLRPEEEDPVVRQFKQDVAAIRDSGYWDIQDAVARIIAKREGIEGVTTYDELKRGVERTIQAVLRRNGITSNYQVDRLTQKFLRDVGVTEAATELKARFLADNEEIMKLLDAWEFSAPFGTARQQQRERQTAGAR